MKILKSIKARAKQLQKTIILPEAKEKRILQAAKIIIEEQLAKIILLGDKNNIADLSEKVGLDISRVKIIEPLKTEEFEKFSQEFYELRKAKGISLRLGRIRLHNLRIH